MIKKSLLFILIVVILLLMPFLFKEKSDRFVIGPNLNELNYLEVSFTNDYDGTKLSGMLFVPDSTNYYPLVVIIHGSGTSSRNNPWYLTIAEHLQNNGIGVLLPDKRGSEKSKGNWVGATLETLATDTESAIDFLVSKSNLNYTKIGVVGMSQGGWIAPIVASKRKDLSFVINISGAMVTTEEQLLFEEYNNIAPYTYDFIAKFISPITTNNLKNRESIASLLGFDPIPYWEKISIPVFIAYGGNDTNCPVEQSINKINEQELEYFITKVYPKGGHGILDMNTNKINSDFLLDMINFIDENGMEIKLSE